SPQTKPYEKPKEPAAASEETPPRTEPETEKEEAVAEKKALESEKKEVIRNIKKESVLSDIKKSAEQASVEPASKESAPGVISLVLDVYYRTISKRIQRSLVLPLNIDSGILLAAQVNFYMKETGEVYNVGIERSSGNLKFDSYCIKAVNDASPLPPPPSELRERIKSDFFVISCESKK
ncbi:MAG: TonB C-terminal domain-containing protein, partial [Candidatus Dadabacteria bacterium]|nr:TonB C-terminal domain-containing protein [Candidatus Dadabacteria bacterium]